MTSVDVHIGPGDEQVFGGIASLYNAVGRYENPDHFELDGEYLSRSFSRLGIDPNRDITVARTADGQIVGLGHLRLRNTSPPVGYFAVLVHPEYRRRGIGTRVLTRIEEMGREREMETLQCNVPSFSPDAVRFAEKHGYRKTGEWIKMAHTSITEIDRPEAPADLTIAEIQDTDADVWADLQNTIFRGSFQYEEVTGKTFLSWTRREGFNRDLFLFGLTDGRPVAYCLGWCFTARDNSDYKSVHIHGIGVLPEYRGRGYGRTLLQEVLWRAARVGMTKSELVVNSDSVAAIALYRTLGYRQRYARIWYEKKIK